MAHRRLCVHRGADALTVSTYYVRWGRSFWPRRWTLLLLPVETRRETSGEGLAGSGSPEINRKGVVDTAPTLSDVADAIASGLDGFIPAILVIIPVVIAIAAFPLMARLGWRLVKSFVR